MRDSQPRSVMRNHVQQKHSVERRARHTHHVFQVRLVMWIGGRFGRLGVSLKLFVRVLQRLDLAGLSSNHLLRELADVLTRTFVDDDLGHVNGHLVMLDKEVNELAVGLRRERNAPIPNDGNVFRGLTAGAGIETASAGACAASSGSTTGVRYSTRGRRRTAGSASSAASGFGTCSALRAAAGVIVGTVVIIAAATSEER